MTGVCKLCRELILANGISPGQAAAAPIDGGEIEFWDLANATRAHLYLRHKDALGQYAGLIEQSVRLLSSLFTESNDIRYTNCQEALRCTVEDQLTLASVVVAPVLPAGGVECPS